MPSPLDCVFLNGDTVVHEKPDYSIGMPTPSRPDSRLRIAAGTLTVLAEENPGIIREITHVLTGDITASPEKREKFGVDNIIRFLRERGDAETANKISALRSAAPEQPQPTSSSSPKGGPKI